MIATNKKENTEVQTALSTAKESVDDGEDVTVAFTNSKKTFPVSICKQDPEGNYVVSAEQVQNNEISATMAVVQLTCSLKNCS